jgi:hypothetical protein
MFLPNSIEGLAATLRAPTGSTVEKAPAGGGVGPVTVDTPMAWALETRIKVRRATELGFVLGQRSKQAAWRS